MQRQFTLEYWVDDDWYVGKLKEVPGVFSQGETFAELEDNIRDAYALVTADVRSATGSSFALGAMTYENRRCHV